jgi:metal-responsive CopG/Arc/MetJ family transcriptional regulator
MERASSQMPKVWCEKVKSKQVISLLVEKLFLERYDRWVKRHGYNSRTAAVLAAMRGQLEGDVKDPGEP